MLIHQLFTNITSCWAAERLGKWCHYPPLNQITDVLSYEKMSTGQTVVLALITSGTPSIHLEELLLFARTEHRGGNTMKLMSCQREHAQSLRSPSPALSPR